MWREYLQVGSRAANYLSANNCFTVARVNKLMPISLKSNDSVPFASWQSQGAHYTLSPSGFRWSITINGHTSWASVRYNSRYEIVSGAVDEPLGGQYPWQMTQSYPGTIPESEFAAPAPVCRTQT